MSNLATQHDDGVFEPDEETLMSALRNQDDIPILMDVVEEQVSISTSQEAHFAQSLSDAPEQGTQADSLVTSCSEAKASSQQAQIHETASLECIAAAISEVLAKRLPEIVQEVMQVLQTSSMTTTPSKQEPHSEE